jgi:hypothetical protein
LDTPARRAMSLIVTRAIATAFIVEEPAELNVLHPGHRYHGWSAVR